ncbi:MAG: SpoIIIAH-like family protein [Bacillota bacterium]|nr:SpoIIIAH-like family protein [Bacillota bacterium]
MLMVLRKKRVLAISAVLLLAAVALTYAAAQEQGVLRYLLTWDVQPPGGGTPTDPAAGKTPGAGTGDQEPAAGQTDFFVDFRLDRERTRAEQLETLRDLINNKQVPEDARRTAADQWLAITKQIGKELELEGLVKAKGFADCIIFLRETQCTAVVKAASLSRGDVAQVGDIIIRGTGLAPKEINILSRAQ